MLRYYIFIQSLHFVPFFTILSSCCKSNTIPIVLEVFHIFLVFINFSWILRGNWFICMKCIFILNILLGICACFITLSTFSSQNARRKRSVLILIFWWRIIRCYWNIFIWRNNYSNMNVTAMLAFFASVWIKKRRVWCFSILVVLLTLTIFLGWLNYLCYCPQYSYVVLVTSCERQLHFGLFTGDDVVDSL